MNETIKEVKKELREKYGNINRIDKCIDKTASMWTESDGSKEDFKNFCLRHFIADETKLDQLTDKFAKHLDTIDGHQAEISRILSEKLHLDLGPIDPADELFGEYNPAAHFTDDFFSNKLAFVVLLNYPVYTLDEKNTLGRNWSCREWTRARLADRFAHHIPSHIIQKAYNCYQKSHNYISSYNICMDKLTAGGRSGFFPKGLKLISHWGLRDELKALYKDKEASFKQQLIEQIFNRIVNQEIPQIVIDNPEVSWDPNTNKVFKDGKEISAEPENNIRYQHLKNWFETAQTLDSWYPDNPDAIKRNFNLNVEISEEKVRELFLSILEAPVIKKCAHYISHRLGRPLRAYDIWYGGFRDASPLPEEQLTKELEKHFPNRESFQKGIPEILEKLGFTEKTAKFLGCKITVDPARGCGHAMGAGGEEYNSHLRTRFDEGRFRFDAYNVAMHELGHCVEQVFSLNMVPSTLMSGVPNTAFTEAFAFVFQGRDQKVIGLEEENATADNFRKLHSLWHCYELCGVSLLCMDTWKFMYDNPQATISELKNYITGHAKEIWNKWYAPVLNEKDSLLLAVYSHMIDHGLYLPNYPIGEMIRSQIEHHIQDKKLSIEMEKLCTQGALTPMLWLEKGMGSPLSTEFMIKAGEKALEEQMAMP